MFCTKCRSENVSVQMVTDMKTKTQHHSVLWWLFIGWWLKMILWFFLTIPMLIIKIFSRKKQKIVTTQRKIAICQSCGNQWAV